MIGQGNRDRLSDPFRAATGRRQRRDNWLIGVHREADRGVASLQRPLFLRVDEGGDCEKRSEAKHALNHGAGTDFVITVFVAGSGHGLFMLNQSGWLKNSENPALKQDPLS